MKIEKTILEDHQVQLKVEVDDDTFDRSKRRAAKKLARDRRIPGFRPGKAPYDIVVRHLGEGAVIEEALDHLVDDIYPVLLEQEEITPYGPGQLKDVKSLAPPELEFLVPLAPRVELGDYRAIRIEYALPEITEADVEKTIDNLRERQAKTEVVDRPADVDDLVIITLHGKEKDDPEGKLIVDLHSTPVVIDPDETDTSGEWPFPGFSGSLKGLSVGDKADFPFDYPEDFERDEDLAGKSVVFEVTVEEVRSRELPDLDDDFARSLGEYEDLAALREDARQHLVTSTNERYESDFESQVLDAVVEGAEFYFPPQMVDDEIATLVKDFTKRLGEQGWDLETYLKANEKDEAALREEFRETAIRRIRRGLAILEVAEKEAIKVSERDVHEEVQRTVDIVSASVSPRESRKILTDEVVHGLVSSAMRDALTTQTFSRLKAIARGEAEAGIEAAEDPDSDPALEEAVEPALPADDPAVSEPAEPPEETEK